MVKTEYPILRKAKRFSAVLLILFICAAFAVTASANGVSLYPGGMPFGVRFATDGIVVISAADVETENGSVNPGLAAGLKPEDIIVSISGKKPQSAGDLAKAAEDSEGAAVELTVKRNGKNVDTEITPALSAKDNEYKFGLWVRDGSAGIGTVTFIIPETLEFAGLGHGICDSETGALLPLREGGVFGVATAGIKRGLPGLPGELSGFLTADVTGTLISNTQTGVYGVFEKLPDNIPQTGPDAGCVPIETASADEVTEGGAYIFCPTGLGKVGRYSVEISHINAEPSKEKNFIVKVTDEDLLSQTGGIVQGMSGSPVIQNGKLIGAVTHVMINDPASGYGIFIENMLENMPRIFS